jgi:peptidoglycan lytic transglycosylase D
MEHGACRTAVHEHTGRRQARAKKAARGLLLALLVVATVARAARAAEAFPRPAPLKHAVEFWKKIFGTYSENQVVVHDAWYLGKTYEVLDFRSWVSDGEPMSGELLAMRNEKVGEAKERIRATLLHLHELGPDPSGLSAEEAKIQALFRDVPDSDKYLAAAERIRSQPGLREKFNAGVAQQSRYLDRMEQVFASRGMPRELARLPLVESCFNIDAYSKVGAAGVWQFMPATGRQYMRVNNAIDERRDPIRATRAAAEHLGGDYESLGSWPLAITAYNHGRGGVAHGVEEVGTMDIGEIATRYHGRAFGFASRNFYAEFLAILDLTSRADLPSLPPLRMAEFELSRPMRLSEAARHVGASEEKLIELNPALMPVVTNDRVPIPRGYALWVPRGGSRPAEPAPVVVAAADDAGKSAEAVEVAEAAAPSDSSEPTEQAAGSTASASNESDEQRAVERGVETLRTRRTVVASSSSSRSSRSGGRESSRHSPSLLASRGAQATRVAKREAPVVVHKVTPGQTLIDIARRYGTTVAMIQGLNNLRQPKNLQAGQRLRVPKTT